MCLSKDAPVITGGLTANEQHTENELCSLNKVEVRTTNSSMSKTPKFPPLHSLKCPAEPSASSDRSGDAWFSVCLVVWQDAEWPLLIQNNNEI